VIRLNAVVLPAPFGPINPRILPSGMVRFTFSKTCKPPKVFEIDDKLNMF